MDDPPMSDDIDRAQNEVDRALAEALRTRKAEGPAATGFCLNCDEPCDFRWCDGVCRDAWEATRTKRRPGA